MSSFYECENCGKSFKTEDSLNTHQDNCAGKVFTSSDSTSDWFCDKCGSQFSTLEQEQEHKMKCKKGSTRSSRVWITIGVILAIILIWGLIGGQIAQKATIYCKVGLFGNHLCWYWQKNTLGQAASGFQSVGNAIADWWHNLTKK